MRVLRRFRRNSSGAAAIEFAVVGVAFMLLSISVIEFGRGLMLRNQISDAIDIAARELLLDKDTTDSELTDTVQNGFAVGDPGKLGFTFANGSDSGVSYKEIQVTYPLTLIIPGLTENSLTLSVTRRIPLLP